MIEVNFIVRNRRAKRYPEDNSPIIVIGDNADYRALFDTDEEWQGKIVTARFEKQDYYYDVLLEDGICTIPVEVLKNGFIKVGLYTDEMATTPCTVRVIESIKEKNGNPIVPTEDIYEQLMELFDNIRNHKQYASIERLRSYLFRVTYDQIADEIIPDDFSPAGCSAYVQNGKLYRNLDWFYNNSIAFNIVCNGFEGMSFSNALTEGNLDNEKISQLPYRITDGRNDYGIMISTHILHNDWDWHGTGDIPLSKVPYLILSQIKSLENFETQIADILANVCDFPAMEELGYLLQFLVTDGTTTYVIIPPESADGNYVVENASSNPKLTNFRWVSDDTVDRHDLQLHPMGVERFNMMPCVLNDLKYTNTYKSPTWLSEFIGERGTTKDSTDEELEAIYDVAHELYLNRTRDGQTWQTFYSVVYSEKGMEVLNVQENFDQNFKKE